MYFENTYDSVGRKALYSILIGLGIHTKLIRLIKMCLNKTYSEIGKIVPDAFPIQNILKQGDVLLPLIFSLGSEYPVRKVQENQRGLKLN
jgi:hypothetical protein